MIGNTSVLPALILVANLFTFCSVPVQHPVISLIYGILKQINTIMDKKLESLKEGKDVATVSFLINGAKR